jgi:hypothetical protein
VRTGFVLDRPSTVSLWSAINHLLENGQTALMTSPQVVGRDGRISKIACCAEEYFVSGTPETYARWSRWRAEFEKILPNAVLSITPHVGDSNDVTLDTAIDVGQSPPRNQANNEGATTHRIAQNSMTIEDGGTVVLAILPRNPSSEDSMPAPSVVRHASDRPPFGESDIDESIRVAVVFVTARLVVPDARSLAITPLSNTGTSGPQMR